MTVLGNGACVLDIGACVLDSVACVLDSSAWDTSTIIPAAVRRANASERA